MTQLQQPNFDRIVTTVDAPDAAEADLTTLALLMDELAHGVIVITRSGRIEYTNRAARAELDRSRFFSMALRAALPVFQAATPEDAALLEDALAKAAQGKRSLVTLNGDGTKLQVAVVPFRGLPGAPNQRLALYFARTTVCASQMLSLFARSRGLTYTEQSVLSVLCEGYSTPEIAEQMGVAVSTIRTHVRSLCAKTGSNGVRELVNQVAVLPPVGQAPVQVQIH